MSRAKQKGLRGEHKTITALDRVGIPSERVPLSGSLGGKYSGDVVIPNIETPVLRVEVKNRESIPKYLFDYARQGGVDAVALTQAGEDIIFILTAEQFARLYRGNHNEHS